MSYYRPRSKGGRHHKLELFLDDEELASLDEFRKRLNKSRNASLWLCFLSTKAQMEVAKYHVDCPPKAV